MFRILQKPLLTITGLITCLLIVVNFIGTYPLCHNEAGQCVDNIFNSFVFLETLVPVFIFSLVTFFMRQEIYQTWIKVALGWLVISIILIAVTQDQPAAGFGPQISFGKGDVALLTSALSVIISLAAIAWGWSASRKKN